MIRRSTGDFSPACETAQQTQPSSVIDAIERPQAQMILDRMTGVFNFSDAKITGLADKHQCEAPGWYKWTDAMPEFGQPQCPPDNFHHLDNNIYRVETGGLNIAVWGDNRQNPGDHVWAGLQDIDEALNAASAIGDDKLQRKTQGYVVPDAFTHGSSEQRVRWFRRGFESGDFNNCDTFSAPSL